MSHIVAASAREDPIDSELVVKSNTLMHKLILILVLVLPARICHAQGTRLLRQPDVSATHLVFTYGGDLWTVERSGGVARRLTSTPAVESNPHFSPDGRTIAFTSNRSGTNAVYVLSIEGGTPKRLSGPGVDFFPWVFRQQQAGPLIGKRTWGGLVKSSVHYALVDGGALTAPDNAVFDPINNQWIAENEGVPPDIEVELDARSVADGRDPQLERAVQEVLRLVSEEGPRTVTPPRFSRPSRRPGR